MLSDNGTHLVGAAKELGEMIQGWDIEKLRDFCAENGIVWQFITPALPHQNGCTESLIKSCKYALKMVVHTYVPIICCSVALRLKCHKAHLKATKDPRDRVEFIQRIVDSFWVRGKNDVFQSLVPRKKWSVDRRNVQVNDVVMTVAQMLSEGNRLLDELLKCTQAQIAKSAMSQTVA